MKEILFQIVKLNNSIDEMEKVRSSILMHVRILIDISNRAK